jgi:hypothetical protein
MKRQSLAYNALCILIAIAGGIYVYFSLFSGPTKPARGVTGPTSPPGPGMDPGGSPGMGPGAFPGPGARPVPGSETGLRVSQAPPDPAPVPRPPAKELDQFKSYTFKDVTGAVIASPEITYFPDPVPALELSYINGSFCLTALPSPSRWILIKHKNFQVVVTDDALSQAPSDNAVLPIAIEAGRPELTATGVIQDKSGKPLPGALVWTVQPQSDGKTPPLPAWVRTDESGRFSISLVRKPNSDKSPLGVLPATDPIGFPQAFEGQFRKEAILKLKPASPVKIILLNAASKPFTNSQVSLESRTKSGGWTSAFARLPVPPSGQMTLPPGGYTAVTSSNFASMSEPVSESRPTNVLSFSLIARRNIPQSGYPQSSGSYQLVKVTTHDRYDHLINDAQFYYEQSPGQWIPAGRVDSDGEISFPVHSIKPTRVGIAFGPDCPPVPAHIATAPFEMKYNNNMINVQFDCDASEPNMRFALRNLNKIKLTDTLRRPMPKGTKVTFNSAGKPVVFESDDQSMVDLTGRTDIYHGGFTVSHPDYGTAYIARASHTGSEIIAFVPLAKDSDAQDPLIFKGKCVDSDGKPLAGIRVAAGRVNDQDTHFRGLKSTFSFALTGPDGTYRFRPFNPPQPKNADENPTYAVTALALDPWFLPVDALTAPGTPATLQLSRADRQVTLSFKDSEGKAASPQTLQTFRIDENGKWIFSAPVNWLPTSGRLPLAYGKYIFYDPKHTFEIAFEFKPTTPDAVELVPTNPFNLASRVIDASTNQPIQGALVLLTNDIHNLLGFGDISTATWDRVEALSQQPEITDVPEELTRGYTKYQKAAVTDAKGSFQINPGIVYKPCQWARIYVLKRGYAPVVSDITFPEDQRQGTWEFAPVQLRPAAYLDVEMATLPQDLPPDYRGETSVFANLGFNAKPAVKSPPTDLISFHQYIAIPQRMELVKTRLTVPANVPLNLTLVRNSFGVDRSTVERVAFTLPDGPITLAPDETRAVTLKRTTWFNVTFKFVSPDDEPLSNFGLKYSLGLYPQVWRDVSFDLSGVKGDGTCQIPCTPRTPVTLAIRFLQIGGDSSGVFEFNFPGFETPPREPVVIRLTQEQIQTLQYYGWGAIVPTRKRNP